MSMTIPWGQKVSDVFIDRLCWIVDDLEIGHGTEDGAGKMMGCFGWETGRTFKASVINKAGSGATGLIQFMPATAQALGTTTAALAKMTEEDQLNYVWKYFAPYKGKLKELSDIYAAILWPKGVGKPDTFVYWDKATKPTTYRQNSGIDMNKNGQITKAEATAKVTKLYEEGFKEGNVREYWPASERDKGVTEPAYSGYAEVLELPPVLPAMTENVDATMPDVQRDFRSVAEAAGVAPMIAERVTPYADIVTQYTKPNVPIASKVSKAVAGWQGNFAGIGAIVGALVLNPDFAKALGGFTLNLARGDGSWGALAALIGAGLIAYRGSRS